MDKQKWFGKIEVTHEKVQTSLGNATVFVMDFQPGWSVADYKIAAAEMYEYMHAVSPEPVYVIADFSNPELSFRRDIIGPVIVDNHILKLSVDGPKNRAAIYFVFQDQRLLSFAKFSASAYQKFINDLMKPEYIVTSRQLAMDRITAG